jgi:hypothetical protein
MTLDDLRTRIERGEATAEHVRAAADRFARDIRGRNRRETTAAVLVSACFAFFAWKLPEIRSGSAGIFVATGVVLAVLWGLGRPRLAVDAPPSAFAAELRRQARLLRWAPLWYAGPLGAAILLFFGAMRGVQPFDVALVGGLTLVVVLLNRVAAGRLTRAAAGIEGGLVATVPR